MSEPLFFNCEVVRAGAAEDGTTNVRLRDLGGAFPARTFIAANPGRKEILATALTAITTRLHVEAALASTTEGSQLQRLYVSREV